MHFMKAITHPLSFCMHLRAVRKVRRGWKHAAKKLQEDYPGPDAASKWPQLLSLVTIMQDLPDEDDSRPSRYLQLFTLDVAFMLVIQATAAAWNLDMEPDIGETLAMKSVDPNLH